MYIQAGPVCIDCRVCACIHGSAREKDRWVCEKTRIYTSFFDHEATLKKPLVFVPHSLTSNTNQQIYKDQKELGGSQTEKEKMVREGEEVKRAPGVLSFE